jgi:replicative DNA helicase
MWQSITEITQDLKQVARTLKIPILAAAQTNRAGGKEGAELDNVGGSLSIIQDSDIVVGLFADDEMKAQKEMEIRLRKNRDGKIGEFRAVWDHEKMEYRQKTLKDTYGRSGTKEVVA